MERSCGGLSSLERLPRWKQKENETNKGNEERQKGERRKEGGGWGEGERSGKGKKQKAHPLAQRNPAVVGDEQRRRTPVEYCRRSRERRGNEIDGRARRGQRQTDRRGAARRIQIWREAALECCCHILARHLFWSLCPWPLVYCRLFFPIPFLRFVLLRALPPPRPLSFPLSILC